MKITSVISCGKKKLTVASKAKDLYIGGYFKLMRETAEFLSKDKYYIIGLKYGLIPPNKILEPYEFKPPNKIKDMVWKEKILRKFKKLNSDYYVFIGRRAYYELFKDEPNCLWLFDTLEDGKVIGYQQMLMRSIADKDWTVEEIIQDLRRFK